MKVAVVGAGVMGPGIAQVFATGGHEVTITDIVPEALDRGMANIRESLDQLEEAGLLAERPAAIISRLRTTSSLAEAAGEARLVVEAVPERLDIKEKVYHELDGVCPQEAVVVSNTSSLPLPLLFPDFRPGRFFVAHFFNPPPVMPLVELVTDARTDQRAVAWLRDVLEGCGKKPIVLKSFKAGFLVNRLQTAMLREASHLVESGVVSMVDLDLAVRAAIGFKSVWEGAFETMDFIGLDTVALACRVIFPDLDASRDVPPMIEEKVRAGQLGWKSGRGFYDYQSDASREAARRREAALIEQLKLWKKFTD